MPNIVLYVSDTISKSGNNFADNYPNLPTENTKVLKVKQHFQAISTRDKFKS